MANDDGEVTREEFMSYAKHSEFFKGQLDKNRDELTLCQNDPFESSNFWFKRVSHLRVGGGKQLRLQNMGITGIFMLYPQTTTP